MLGILCKELFGYSSCGNVFRDSQSHPLSYRPRIICIEGIVSEGMYGVGPHVPWLRWLNLP
jgi:hypothetical protein